MARMVVFTIGGRRAVVSFVSRYHGENDFEIHQDGKTGRVHQSDDGRVWTTCEHFSQDDAVAAVNAHGAADAAEFERWKAAHPHLVKAGA